MTHKGPVTGGYDRGNGCGDNEISRIHRRFHRLQYGTTLQPTIKGYTSGDERQLYKEQFELIKRLAKAVYIPHSYVDDAHALLFSP
jgi:hypothetical protein